MKFRFADPRLQRQAENFRLASQEWGSDVARRLVRRLTFIVACASAADLYEGPGRFHSLTGDMKGEYAFDLSGNMRLVVEFDGDVLVVLRVEDYH
jgi:plasmid maintenance system killer protein